MADSEDQESRTEEPTEKKLSDAIEKGDIPIAREATLFGSLLASFATLLVLGAWSASALTEALRYLLGSAGQINLEDREGAATFLTTLAIRVAWAVLPVLFLVATGAVLASVLQNPPSATPDRIEPKASRISPAAGWTRLFGKQGWFEFLRATLKLVVAFAIVTFAIKAGFPVFAGMLGVEPSRIAAAMQSEVARSLGWLLGLAGLLALFDLVWSRWSWRRRLRITRHEIKEEFKQAEGDPQIKARIRSIARHRASRRMLDKLPKASMVVVNPTHYAVALRYTREEGGAPVVVAKGVDHMALKIREIATEHEIPLVEDKPLARALYDSVDLDREIPPEFYRAVAEIIRYLHQRNRLPSQRRR